MMAELNRPGSAASAPTGMSATSKAARAARADGSGAVVVRGCEASFSHVILGGHELEVMV